MKKLYEKSQLIFAIVCIVAYVVLFSVADGISAVLGVEKSVTAGVGLAMSALLLYFVYHNGLQKEYGLCKSKFPAKTYLYFLPLALIVSVNLWGGATLNYSPAETVLFIVSMICVGFLEELIFRGFLFTAMRKDGLVSAMIVSSLTFGIGHIVNLLGGADFLPTLMQILYATSAGFLFTVIFHKSGNLLPCIIGHAVMNSLSAFLTARSPVLEWIIYGVLIVLPVLYALWILKTDKRSDDLDKGENA